LVGVFVGVRVGLGRVGFRDLDVGFGDGGIVVCGEGVGVSDELEVGVGVRLGVAVGVKVGVILGAGVEVTVGVAS
jgi:hypothetical protein